MSEKQESKFELIASMRVGWCMNQTQSADKILVTPVAEPGILGLYNAKKTIHYRSMNHMEESIQVSQYELRWKPISKESDLKEIIVRITDEYEFIKYKEVKEGVMFLLRKKKAWTDHFPYFFWSQEADSNAHSRFLSSMSLCMEMLEKDKTEIEKMNTDKMLDLNEFIKSNNVMSIFDNEAICKKLYPYVSECLRSPSGLKKIVSSPSFRKNVGLFQYAMDYIGIDSAFSIYSIDNSDLPGDDTIEMGSKSYIKRIEMWAKEEIEKEKQEKEKNNCCICFTIQYSY